MQTEQRASCAFGRREQGKAVRIRRNGHYRVPKGESGNLPCAQKNVDILRAWRKGRTTHAQTRAPFAVRGGRPFLLRRINS